MQPQPYILLAPTEPAVAVSEWIAVAIESHQLGRWADAERQLRHALHIDPRNARAFNNLACAYAAGNNYKEALLAVERASLLTSADDRETTGIVFCNWALLCLDMEQIDAAISKASRAVSVYPCKQTRLTYALCWPVSGRAEESLPLYNAILDEDPKHFVAGMNASFAQTLTPLGPKELLAQRRRFYEGQRQIGSGKKHHSLSVNGKPLRVGYVSGDFRRHSASSIFGAVVLKHSPRVEVYLYSTLPVDCEADPVSKKYRDFAGERWRDISALPDDQAEERVRKDRIDILIDLSGHTGGSRLGLFTRRPAPVQATGWGFAHGTGCPEIDYFFADPVAVPEAEREHYAERVIDLPCIVTYDPPDYPLAGASEAPYLKAGHVTFGCYSRYEKLSTAYLATCQEILLAVPSSQIEFKDHAFRQPYAVKRVMDIMDRIDPRRIAFRIGTSQADHLLSYQHADLILDPFPHSGGTACLEQLWMGVPMVTLYGTQAAGRTASSVLSCMGLSYWSTVSREGYINTAVNWAKYPGVLAKVRKTLRQDLLNSPVVKGYVAAVEETYERIIREKAACQATK